MWERAGRGLLDWEVGMYVFREFLFGGMVCVWYLNAKYTHDKGTQVCKLR